MSEKEFLTLGAYTDQAMSTCLPQCFNPAYLALKLVGEWGEAVTELRDSSLDNTRAVKELGDVMWYLSVMNRLMKFLPETTSMKKDTLEFCNFTGLQLPNAERLLRVNKVPMEVYLELSKLTEALGKMIRDEDITPNSKYYLDANHAYVNVFRLVEDMCYYISEYSIDGVQIVLSAVTEKLTRRHSAGTINGAGSDR